MLIIRAFFQSNVGDTGGCPSRSLNPEFFRIFYNRNIPRSFWNESPLKLNDIKLSTHKSIVTRCTVGGLIDIPYSGTAEKRKLLANTMIRVYIFLVDLDFIPDDLVNWQKIKCVFYHEYFISLYHRQKIWCLFLFEHRTVIVLRLDQRNAKWRTLLLILRPPWILVCRVRHVFLNISIYKYEYPMKLTVSVSVSHSNVISFTSIDFLRG